MEWCMAWYGIGSDSVLHIHSSLLEAFICGLIFTAQDPMVQFQVRLGYRYIQMEDENEPGFA